MRRSWFAAVMLVVGEAIAFAAFFVGRQIIAERRPEPDHFKPDAGAAGQLGQHVNAYMPVNAGVLILQPARQPGDLLPPWQGFAVFGGWTVLLLVIAAVMFQRRDA